MNQTFIRNVHDLYGEEGSNWVKRIPQLIDYYQSLWNITVYEPFELSYNYVAPAQTKEGKQTVLKLGFPGNKELISECTALQLFNGQGSAQLLKNDIENGVMLLEHVIPGIPLSRLPDDEQQTRIACQVLKKLHIPAPHNNSLIQLNKWLNGYQKHRERFGGSSGPLPNEIFSLGEHLVEKHYHNSRNNVLLHGDFHHHNILSSNRNEWLTIDTKGVVGNPAYDVAVFLYNPTPHLLNVTNLKHIIKRRIEIFSSELGIRKETIIEWGIIQSILSSIWKVEDHGTDWDYGITFAKLLMELHNDSSH